MVITEHEISDQQHSRGAQRFFVVTGGPGSGKTTLIDALEQAGSARSEKAGRGVIQDQVAVGGHSLPWANQIAFAELMLSWEMRSYHLAQCVSGPVFFDRGVPDVVGYLRLIDRPVRAHVDKAAQMFRYNRRVFVGPLWRDIFGQDRERKQDFAEAVHTYEVMITTYSDYGYQLIEIPRAAVKERVDFVLTSLGRKCRIGEFPLQLGRDDIFSYTLVDKPWCDWEWASDAIFALVYRLHGLSAVAALALLVLCLVSVVVYRTARLYSGPVAAGITCALVMAATTIHWLARPHLFTWLALAILCWRLERPASKEELFALTAMMVVWVNLHPVFVVGFLVLAAYFAGAVLESRLRTTRGKGSQSGRRFRWYALAIAVAAATTLVNPYGIGLDRHIISYLFSRPTVTAHVSEWLSPEFHNPRLAWFELLLPLAAAAGVWHGLKHRFDWCLLIFGFMHLALLSVRNVPLFAIVCTAPVAAAGEEVLLKLDFWRYVREAEGVAKGSSRVRMTLALWGIGFAAIVAVGVSPVRLGAGSSIPVAAVRRLPPGRLFTTDQWADYLIYAQPDRRVFFDGRNDFYGPAFVQAYLTLLKAEPGWQEALAHLPGVGGSGPGAKLDQCGALLRFALAAGVLGPKRGGICATRAIGPKRGASG